MKTKRMGIRRWKVFPCYETMCEELQRAVQTAQTCCLDVDTTKGMVLIVSGRGRGLAEWASERVRIADKGDVGPVSIIVKINISVIAVLLFQPNLVI